jgi:hypothetical protein
MADPRGAATAFRRSERRAGQDPRAVREAREPEPPQVVPRRVPRNDRGHDPPRARPDAEAVPREAGGDTRPGTAATRSITGTTSGIVSIIPAQAARSRGRPSAGKAAPKASCTPPSSRRSGGGSSTRIASKGDGPSALHRRGVPQAFGKPRGAAGLSLVERQSFRSTGPKARAWRSASGPRKNPCTARGRGCSPRPPAAGRRSARPRPRRRKPRAGARSRQPRPAPKAAAAPPPRRAGRATTTRPPPAPPGAGDPPGLGDDPRDPAPPAGRARGRRSPPRSRPPAPRPLGEQRHRRPGLGPRVRGREQRAGPAPGRSLQPLGHSPGPIIRVSSPCSRAWDSQAS